MTERPFASSSRRQEMLATVTDMREFIYGLTKGALKRRSKERRNSDRRLLVAYDAYDLELQNSDAPTEVMPTISIEPVRQTHTSDEIDRPDMLETEEY